MEIVYVMIEIVKSVYHPFMVLAPNAIQDTPFHQIIHVVVIFHIVYYAMMIYVMFVKKVIPCLNLVLYVNLI